jgi:hypothetical protein
LIVAFETSRPGERSLDGLASHEVDVLPNQPAPDGLTNSSYPVAAWPAMPTTKTKARATKAA